MPLRNILGLLLALFFGTALGWFLSERASGTSRASAEDTLVAMQASLQDVRAAIKELRAEVTPDQSVHFKDEDQHEELLQEPGSLRTPVESHQGATLDAQIEAFRKQLASVTGLLTSLQPSMLQGQMPASFPSHELLVRMPVEQNWAMLDELIEEHRAASAEGSFGPLGHLRWQPQEHVLRTYGRPTTITDVGDWIYYREGAQPSTVQFSFIRDYVMNLQVY